MKKIIANLLVIAPLIVFAQVQIGTDILSTGDGTILGLSLNEDGTRVAIGTPLYDGVRGKVVVYSFDGSQWTQTGQDIIGENPVDFTGYSIDLNASGDRLIVGSLLYNTNQGRVVVYDYNGTNWVQVGSTILGSNPSDCGRSVSISDSGSAIAVGENGTNNSTGRVRVFDFDGSDWVLKGQELNGSVQGSTFGFSVDLNDAGDRIAVGSPNYEEGSITMFEFDGNAWSPLGQEIKGDAMADRLGEFVSLNGSGFRVAVGAPGNDSAGVGFGLVRVYEYNGQQWQAVGQDITGPDGDSFLGRVALSDSGNALAVGNSGAVGDVFIYELENSQWANRTQFSDGISVAFNGSGSRFATGGTEVTRIYDLSGILNTSEKSSGTFSIYPSPTAGIVYVKAKNSIVRIDVYNVLGSLVQSAGNQNVIDISGLGSGVYLIRIYDEFANHETKRVVKL